MRTKVTLTKNESYDPFVIEIKQKYSSAIDSMDKMIVEGEELQRAMNREFERLKRVSILMNRAR